MIISTDFVHDGLVVVNISGQITLSRYLHDLKETIDRLKDQGRRGIIFNCFKVKRINMAGLAALVEIVARHPKLEIGFCSLPAKIMQFIEKSGLDRGLLIFKDVETAKASTQFQSHALTGTKTVLLCAGKGSRVAPLTDVTPKPLLNVGGQPTLHRIINHLDKFGLRDVTLNPGHLGYQVIEYFQNLSLPDHKIQFSNEGHGNAHDWKANPIGSASTLKRLQVENAAFSSDFVVLCGDALIDIDFAAMMQAHRDSGASVTVAALTVPEEDVSKYGMIETDSAGMISSFVEKPNIGETNSRLANTGIYIFHPRVLDLIPNMTDLDIGYDLLPKVLASNLKMHAYSQPFSWIDIGCGTDFAVANQLCLTGQIPGQEPSGRKIGANVWSATDAVVSTRANISGSCHIGDGARIEAGAHLEGVCSIGAGAIIESGTMLKDCIVMPDTHVARGAWAENMIIHGNWAVDHTRANGSLQNRDPLDYTQPLFQENSAPSLSKSA